MIRILPVLIASSLIAFGSCLAGPKVVFETSLGNFTVELDDEKAPITTKNFLQYVEDGHYDGVVFHRIISGFMIQTGGFALEEDGQVKQKKARDPIQNEAKNGLKNVRGSLAMARTGDPHSASAQFFINHVDNDNLDFPSFDGWGYAVFGKVVEGLDVVDKIAAVETATKTLHALHPSGQHVRSAMEDVPVENVVIKSAKKVEEEE